MRTRATRIMRWATIASSGVVFGGIGIGGGNCLRDDFFVDVLSDSLAGVASGFISAGFALVGITI